MAEGFGSCHGAPKQMPASAAFNKHETSFRAEALGCQVVSSLESGLKAWGLGFDFRGLNLKSVFPGDKQCWCLEEPLVEKLRMLFCTEVCPPRNN